LLHGIAEIIGSTDYFVSFYFHYANDMVLKPPRKVRSAFVDQLLGLEANANDMVLKPPRKVRSVFADQLLGRLEVSKP
jgi:hypothetical protein